MAKLYREKVLKEPAAPKANLVQIEAVGAATFEV
jgi:hypothetical protein